MRRLAGLRFCYQRVGGLVLVFLFVQFPIFHLVYSTSNQSLPLALAVFAPTPTPTATSIPTSTPTSTFIPTAITNTLTPTAYLVIKLDTGNSGPDRTPIITALVGFLGVVIGSLVGGWVNYKLIDKQRKATLEIEWAKHYITEIVLQKEYVYKAEALKDDHQWEAQKAFSASKVKVGKLLNDIELGHLLNFRSLSDSMASRVKRDVIIKKSIQRLAVFLGVDHLLNFRSLADSTASRAKEDAILEKRIQRLAVLLGNRLSKLYSAPAMYNRKYRYDLGRICRLLSTLLSEAEQRIRASAVIS